MIDQVINLFKTNQFASGGLFLLLSGAVLGIIYRIQGYISQFIRYWFFTEISFTSDDPNFLAIQNWLFQQNYTTSYCPRLMVRDLKSAKKSFNNDYQYRNIFGDGDDEPPKTNTIFIPAYGTHYFMLGYRPTILHYTKNDAKELRHQEYINLQIFNFFKKHQFAAKIVGEANSAFGSKKYTETPIYGCADGYHWSLLLKKNIRQNPILATPDEYQSIVDCIARFNTNQTWYFDRGINYKHGFLFAGVPGSGKTSCVLSLAQHFKRNIYMINLSDANIDDAKFVDLVTSIPKNSFFLIEDIDALSQERKTDDKVLSQQERGISLSTILNTLDGLLTPEGLVFFITTNYPEKLDDALIRPGRIDMKKDFKNANHYQVSSLFDRFAPNQEKETKESFVSRNLGKPMAAVEAELIEKII